MSDLSGVWAAELGGGQGASPTRQARGKKSFIISISVQRNGGKCQKQNCPSSPDSNARC